MAELFTFGETMAAFLPDRRGPLRYTGGFRMSSAGAESNTAINLCKLGHSAAWAGWVGEDEFGAFLLREIRGEGVDVSAARQISGGQTGLLFKELGDTTVVTYYRDTAAMRLYDADSLDTEKIREAKFLHLTGITPVLSQSCEAACRRAIAIAREYGVRVSFDPNVRKKLWKGRDFAPVLWEFLMEADVAILGRSEAALLLGTNSTEKIFNMIFQEGRAEYAAVKDGDAGAWVARRGEAPIFVPPYPCCCEDPVGAGDAFNAGFLAGLLESLPLLECAQLGAAAGAMVTRFLGDYEGCPNRKQADKWIRGEKEEGR